MMSVAWVTLVARGTLMDAPYCADIKPLSATSSSIAPKASDWARRLGWKSATNRCKGYFSEPDHISAIEHPAPIGTTTTTITAEGQMDFFSRQASTLTDNVVVSQPGRELTADKAILYPNSTSGQVDRIDLIGDVRYLEAGKMAAGRYSHIDLAKKTLFLCQGAYRILRPSFLGNLYGWGETDQFYRQSDEVMQLKQATFTTCSPEKTLWQLKADRLTLNPDTGRGVARDAWFYIGKMPLFYTPYANFPIDKRRYSGFLYPTMGYQTGSGFIFNIPYYLNLAPNYDDTFTVTPMTHRGVQISNLFRYLTENSQGFLQGGIIPHDSEFANFKQVTPLEFPANSYNAPFLNALANDSDTRAGLGFHHITQWNDRWSAALDANYVTDDYYLRDLGNTPQAITTDQLLNQALLNYQSEHWRFQGEVQAYQTLHLIDQTFVADQYQRLPQLDIAASYPDLPGGLDLEANGEWVSFQHVNDFFTDQPYPTGSRLHGNPQVSLPLLHSGWFFTPTIGLDTTTYYVSDNAIVNTTSSTIPFFYATPETTLNGNTRTLPILNADTGLYLENNWSLFRHRYRQTLEPRLYYLYVPYANQNDTPIFDTTLPAFGVDQLFRMNRFVGYDRLGDANQVSVGLTSRTLDDFSGEEKLNATIGQIYYFTPHQVCLYPDCSDDPTAGESVSPITGQLNYHPNSRWTATINAAWDPKQAAVTNESLEIRYSPAPQHMLKLGYQFVPNGDLLTSAPPNSSQNNLQRIDLGMAWQISERWTALVDWNYNLSHHYEQAYVYGLEYDSCCVAVRLLASRTMVSASNTNAPEYQTNVFVQVLFKGLGTVGSTQSGALLNKVLPGYQDRFSRG